MAKKDKKGRLVISLGYLNAVGISSSDELWFVTIDKKKVAILKDSIFDELRRKELSSRVIKLAKCKLEKNEKFENCITIPSEVEAVLGKGKQYYFSIFDFSAGFKPFLCINK